jgi:hypothetical protein
MTIKQPTLAPEIYCRQLAESIPAVGKIGKNCQARCASYKQLGRDE